MADEKELIEKIALAISGSGITSAASLRKAKAVITVLDLPLIKAAARAEALEEVKAKLAKMLDDAAGSNSARHCALSDVTVAVDALAKAPDA